MGAPTTLAVYFLYDVTQYDPSEWSSPPLEGRIVDRPGLGPAKDVHSSLAAQVDSPAWHLVQALNALVKADGHTPNVDGFFDKVRPRSACSGGSRTNRGRRRSNGSCRSRRSTSRDSSAATPATAANDAMRSV